MALVTLAKASDAPLAVITAYGVNGAVLWLSADYGVKKDDTDSVIALKDRTANFTLSASDPDVQPTYVKNGLNGHPVLQFQGSQLLSSPDDFGEALDHDMSFVLVARTSNSSLHREQFPLYLGQNTTIGGNRAIACLNGKYFFDGQFVGFYGHKVVKNTFSVLEMSTNASLTQGSFYNNGIPTVINGFCKEGKNNRFTNLTEGVTLGAAHPDYNSWQGEIAEVLVFNRQLLPVEMKTVSDALIQKYRIFATDPQ